MRVVVVDDERPARDGLRARLLEHADVELVGEAADGVEAVERIAALRPDVVFLDVQMPEVDGFEVLERVAAVHLPIVVFVSAHDRFAVRAFEAHALDYLLKPFSRDRFEDALRRVRAELALGERRGDAERLAALLDARRGSAAGDDCSAARTPIARFVVWEHGRFLLVPAADVVWIESAGNYARIHAGGRDHLVRVTMKELEARLDPTVFARVHRTAIVNIARVREIRPGATGDYDVVLEGGTTVPMSRTHRSLLKF